jgi:hypothetical protein
MLLASPLETEDGIEVNDINSSQSQEIRIHQILCLLVLQIEVIFVTIPHS